MATIKLPRIPWNAYDENRPANALLLAQVRELERAVRAAGRRVVSGHPKTEGEAAAYIRHLNRALHHQVLLPALKRRPLRAPSQAGGARKTGGSRAAATPANKAGGVKKAGRVKKASRARGARKPGKR
jgi:hypothetical protein